ncbi:MAG: chemotaxis protein CheX [Anaerolineaceae bacterium]|nr:chemotaxis protein CheX [Anaerolineaceae bacterium]
MNVKTLLPFIEAAVEVMKAEAGIIMNRGNLVVATEPYLTSDVTVIISMVGGVLGTVIYGMDKQTALKISSTILGETLTEFDSLAQSGVAELGNVITGRASVKLSQSGFETTISPPTLLLGRGAKISTLDLPRLIVPLVGPIGEITTHLAIKEDFSGRDYSTPDIKIPDAPDLA